MSVKTRWRDGRRLVLLEPEAVEAVVEVLRRGDVTDCGRAWRDLLAAIREADAGRRERAHLQNGGGTVTAGRLCARRSASVSGALP